MHCDEYYDFLKRAEAGEEHAMFCLADHLLGDDNGNPIAGFPHNPHEAERWFNKIIDSSSDDAFYKGKALAFLATEYRYGAQLPKNLNKAIEYYKRAANLGDTFSKEALEDLQRQKKSSGGCYVATCVYGSYDCPEVWMLRRFRDNTLLHSWLGKQFVQVYYAVSPKFVKLFGNKRWFNKLWKPVLDRFAVRLQNNGVDNSPYSEE
jgi:TPR repeat protein